MLDIILSQVATGLVLGCLYVLIAIGLSIIFGMLGIVNFAHGAFFALGAYFALMLHQHFGWPAVLLAPLMVGAVGMVVEMTADRQLYGKEPLLGLIITFALALLIEALLRLVFGGRPAVHPPPFLSGFYLGPDTDHQISVTVLVTTVAVLIGALGVPELHALRPHPARRLARPRNGRPARHQPAARASPRCSASAAVSRVSPACWRRRFGP